MVSPKTCFKCLVSPVLSPRLWGARLSHLHGKLVQKATWVVLLLECGSFQWLFTFLQRAEGALCPGLSLSESMGGVMSTLEKGPALKDREESEGTKASALNSEQTGRNSRKFLEAFT